MNEHESGQVAGSAARVYEDFFVPALFSRWPRHVLAGAGVRAGQHVCDVACGTGVLARHAAGVVGPTGSVAGVDINASMLAVARAAAPAIEWREAPAEALPFDDATFDRVVSQFGLMFFTDRAAALGEMRRVTRTDGRVAIAVWSSLEETPGYAAMRDLLRDLFGEDVAQSLEAPYALGDRSVLAAILRDAAVHDATIETLTENVRFPSLRAWLTTDIRGWTLADRISEAEFYRILAAAPARLERFVLQDGSIAFDAPAHIVSFPP